MRLDHLLSGKWQRRTAWTDLLADLEATDEPSPQMALEIERPLLSAVVERSMRVSWSSIAPSCALAAAGSVMTASFRLREGSVAQLVRAPS